MALQSSGEISLNDIGTEFQDAQPHSLSEFYGVASGVPGSGEIDFADFYGTSFLTSHTLDTNTANLNVYDYAVANGYSSGPYQLTIDSGVYVYTTSSTPALRINGGSSQGFAAGTTVTIINNGYVAGGPGSGGSGGSSSGSGGSSGGKGGTAIQVQPSGSNITNIITFTNNGSVVGGGGGGGGGGAGTTNTVSGTTTQGPYSSANSYEFLLDTFTGCLGISWGANSNIFSCCCTSYTMTSYTTGGWTYNRGSQYRSFTDGKLTFVGYSISRTQSTSTTHTFTAGGAGGLGGYYNGSSFVNGASGGSASGGGNAQATGGNGGSGGNIGVAGSSGSNGGGGASGGGGGAIGHYWHRNASLSGSGAWTFTNNGTATGTTAN